MTIQNRINRLLSYKHLLNRFKSLGLVRVFSDNIADPLGISASLVRKDFGLFGISGSQKGGYSINDVLEKINEILGSNEVQRVIVVGVGRIGEALMSYNGFPLTPRTSANLPASRVPTCSAKPQTAAAFRVPAARAFSSEEPSWTRYSIS